MEFTTEDEPDLTLPEGVTVRAVLQEIKPKLLEWNDRKTGDKMEKPILDWWWEVTQTNLGPEYIGRKVRGTCDQKITSRANNPMRNWFEALLDRKIPVGMKVDTDDVVGLQADIVIGWRFDKQDTKQERPFEYVKDVIGVQQSYDNEPPF